MIDYSAKTYEELQREQDRLEERYESIQDDCLKEGVSYIDFCERAHDVKEKLYFISKYRILPYYFVYFIDGKGNVVSEQRIMEGEAAIEPMANIRDRFMDKDKYTFLCWSIDFSKVMHDLVINSLYLEVK